MREVLRQFPVTGELQSCEPIGAGHIHKTYLVETDAGSRYIFQQLNRRVFPDVDKVMENLTRIGAFLDAEHRAVPMIRYLETSQGRKLYDDGLGGTWRAYPFVPNSICVRKAETPDDLYQAALAFGGFLHGLRGFPAEQLQEPIPDFHNTPARFRQFRDALGRDSAHRRAEVEQEIAFVLAREEWACALQRLREQGSLPVRVTHNDAKLSNVLLDANSRKALCVIDLDTVMPGLAAFDFGDLVRSGGAAAAEDEQDLTRIGLDPERFRAIVRGFSSGCPDLTEAERGSLTLGAYTMTLECGLRFLTDYLDGDRYFAVEREKQNMDRARSQFALAEDMERRWETMTRIVNEIDG